MFSKILVLQVTFLFTIVNTIPVFENQADDVESWLVRSTISQDQNKKQLLWNEPEQQYDLPPHSYGLFDAFGHHLTGHINHGGVPLDINPGSMVHMENKMPYKVTQHEYQFHAPDIDYWWPNHWPHHLPPPFPFHRQKDDKKKDEKKDEKKEKGKEKDKKKGKARG